MSKFIYRSEDGPVVRIYGNKPTEIHVYGFPRNEAGDQLPLSREQAIELAIALLQAGQVAKTVAGED